MINYIVLWWNTGSQTWDRLDTYRWHWKARRAVSKLLFNRMGVRSFRILKKATGVM